MAYNYFPQYYQPATQIPMQAQRIETPAMQIQNGGFVSVRSEAEARSYPVALGNSITFKDELAPYIYTKTMGFSQLDTPKFEKYRLVKEATETPLEAVLETPEDKSPAYDAKSQIEAIWGEIEVIKQRIVEASSASAPKQEKEVEKDGKNSKSK